MQTKTAMTAAEIEAVRTAEGFITTLFIGRGEFSKHPTATIAEAREVGRQMVAHYDNGRRPMVYAQLRDGRQILVPDDFKEEMMTAQNNITETEDDPAKTYNKRFNAQRGAKRHLGESAAEGIDFVTERVGAEWTWRAIETPPVPAEVTSIDITQPDFSAKTHTRFRPKLAAVVAMVEARDIEGLRNFHMNPSSTSPRAIMRYRDKAIAAIEASQGR